MAGGVLAEFVYNDGNGAAQIDVSIGVHPGRRSGVDDAATRATRSAPRPAERHRTDRRDRQGTEYPAARTSEPSTAVYVVRADGVEILMSEFNAPQEKDSASPARAAALDRPADASSRSGVDAVGHAGGQRRRGRFVPGYLDARARTGSDARALATRPAPPRAPPQGPQKVLD